MTTPHPRRRFFRYSLRTLFVVVTVFCVWMGITAKRARDQKLAVQAVEALGGTVRFEHQDGFVNFEGGILSPHGSDGPGPEWLRQLIGEEYFFCVDEVHFIRSNVDDASLAVIKGFPNFQLLAIDEFDSFIFDSRISDAGLVHLNGLTNLEELHLRATQITDAGLEHLKGLTNLKWLTLWGTQVVGTGLVHLEGLTNLETLDLQGPITDAGLEYVKGLTNLKHLSIESTEVTDRGLEHLKELSNLELLSIESTEVTDWGLQHLRELSNLELLAIRKNITDAGLVHLTEMSNLEVLDLQLTEVTLQGLKTLQQALPNCRFLYTGDDGSPKYLNP